MQEQELRDFISAPTGGASAGRRSSDRKVKRKTKRNRWDKYVFKSAGVSYKKVLPPEKWPYIEHFLLTLYQTIRSKSDEMTGKLDVGAFMKEYKKIY